MGSMAEIKYVIALILTILASVQPSSVSFSKRAEYWHHEINESLRLNLKGSCQWKELPGYSVPLNNSNIFLLTTLLPTKSEWTSLQSLPVSLTRANKALVDLAHLNKIYNETFIKRLQWQIPDDHPAQNRILCYNLTKLASQEGVLDLYQSFRSVDRSFYLLRNRRAVISPLGSIGLNCGYYQGKEGCETRWDKNQDKWYNNCNAALLKANLNWETPWDDSNAENRDLSIEIIKNCSTKWEIYEYKLIMPTEHLFRPKFHKRVFVLENQWDYNYHHFIADCLARLARNIKFLRANPDVMIHIRAMEEYDTLRAKWSKEFRAGIKTMRNRLFNLLGISSDRIIYDIVLADEVFIPRTLHCAYALSNPIEVRTLSREILKAAAAVVNPLKREKLSISPHWKKNLIIQQRYTTSSNDRAWSDMTTKRLVSEFQLLFPDHNVIVHSSQATSKPDYCLTCEINELANADILVGNHGAGLTSSMFMPINSLIVEVVAIIKNVNMPVCGYYGPWSSMFGQHHYLYAYRYKAGEHMSIETLALEAQQFYQQLHNKPRNSLNITTLYYDNIMIVDPDQ